MRPARAASWRRPRTRRARPANTWVSVALTYRGLEALGVPQDSLDSFAWEFRQGMAARRRRSATRARAPRALGAAARNERRARRAHGARARPGRARGRARRAPATALRASCRASRRSGARTATRSRTGTEPFGFRDGIGHPAIEGSGIPGTNPREAPFKAGEFVLGYPDETGGFPPMPQPEVLGRNGTYVVFRKLHQRVAAFRALPEGQRAQPRGARSSSRRR